MVRPIVVKFGGAALGDLPRVLERVRAIREGGSPVVVVASARSGVTDRLFEITLNPRARARHRQLLGEIADLHGPPGREVAARVAHLRALVASLERGRAVSPRTRDRLLSEGERLAVRWLADRLSESGVASTPLDADALGLKVERSQGMPTLRLADSAARVRRGLGAVLAQGRVPVVTGYFGRGPDGEVMTLGRGGSDYSASGIAALVHADRLELVKGAVSVRTADPGEVPDAPPLSALSYEEAEELAQFGARVLHPLTIAPARASGIPIWVRSLTDPYAVTVIGAASGRRHRALTRLGPFGLLRVSLPGGRERPGVLSRVGSALERIGVPVLATFSSSSTLTLAVDAPRSARALTALRRVPGLVVEPVGEAALLTVVGEGVMTDLPRLPSQLLATAWGLFGSTRSLSILVPVPVGGEALRTLHAALLPPPGPEERREGRASEGPLASAKHKTPTLSGPGVAHPLSAPRGPRTPAQVPREGEPT